MDNNRILYWVLTILGCSGGKKREYISKIKIKLKSTKLTKIKAYYSNLKPILFAY
jgi:hypothetical protein